ncbi:hypothetical protein RZN22_01270 [Bacillaceae bacterium S4-13-58]
MNRGYAGFYNGFYLRSSYEYAYAKYLDHHSIQWSYEDDVYDVGNRLYKPDFFFYDNGKLIKIVEIKSRNKAEKERSKIALKIIKEKFSIDWELISYEELLELYKDLPFSLTSTINEWINSDKTSINKSQFGKLKGHYNLKHSDKTKREIGKHTKLLWESDNLTKQRMIEGLRKSGLSQKENKKSQEKFVIAKVVVILLK